MRLSQVQRLSALMRQAEKHVRQLASVQRRVSALILTAGDLTLSEDVLDTLEAVLAQADATLNTMYTDLLLAREAADSGEGLVTNEGECN